METVGDVFASMQDDLPDTEAVWEGWEKFAEVIAGHTGLLTSQISPSTKLLASSLFEEICRGTEWLRSK